MSNIRYLQDLDSLVGQTCVVHKGRDSFQCKITEADLFLVDGNVDVKICFEYIGSEWIDEQDLEALESGTFVYSSIVFNYLKLDVNEGSNFPNSSIPEFNSSEWVNACNDLFGGLRKK